MRTFATIIFLNTMIQFSVYAQILNKANNHKIELNDGVKITVYESADRTHQYYYIPHTLQLAERKNAPEISLLLYQDKNKQITGGILHVLVRWGLKDKQEQQLKNILTSKIDSLAVLQGAAEIQLITGELDFDESAIAKALKESSNQSIKVPSEAIHKTAASFNLTAQVAQFFYNEINSPGKAKSVRISTRYTYRTVDPSNLVREANACEAEMTTTLKSWINALKQYQQIKIVTL